VPGGHAPYAADVLIASAVEAAVEPAEEALFSSCFLALRLRNGGAQGRRQRQCDEPESSIRRDDGEREFP